MSLNVMRLIPIDVAVLPFHWRRAAGRLAVRALIEVRRCIVSEIHRGGGAGGSPCGISGKPLSKKTRLHQELVIENVSASIRDRHHPALVEHRIHTRLINFYGDRFSRLPASAREDDMLPWDVIGLIGGQRGRAGRARHEKSKDEQSQPSHSRREPHSMPAYKVHSFHRIPS